VRNRLVRFPDPIEAVLADVVDEPNPYVPDRPMRRRVSGSERTEMMPHYGLVEPVETSIAPRAYVVPATPPSTSTPPAAQPPAQGPPPGQGRPPGQFPPGMRPGIAVDPAARIIASVADRLQAHGITFYRTGEERTINAERFRIESSTQEEREYQGTHKLRTLTGAWEPAAQPLPAGSLVVPMDQPLARLAFMLFDPRSDDGFSTWNILDPVLAATPAPEFYPVWRTMETVAK
jgi:hypothetical protein